MVVGGEECEGVRWCVESVKGRCVSMNSRMS